jgi:hypothetical protein
MKAEVASAKALGGACLAFDTWPHLGTPKLGSVQPGSIEAYYMLAAYCFEAARKMEYCFKATKGYALKADKALAAEIKRDNEAVVKAGPGWEGIAKKSEEILRRLIGEVAPEHERLLKAATAKKR